MLKLLIICVCGYAVLSAPTPFPIDHLSTLFPIKDLSELINRHLIDDKGFKAAIKYFKTPEWQQMISDLRQSSDWQNYKKHVRDAGLDIDYFIQHIEKCFNSTDMSLINNVDVAEANLDNFVTDLIKDYSVYFMQAFQKISHDTVLKAYMEKIMDAKGLKLMKRALETTEMKAIIDKLEGFKLPVKNILNLIHSVLPKSTDN